MNLYYSPGACSLAPHIVLEEIGVPYQRTLVSTSDGSTRSADYLTINPKGRVPVLAINDIMISEASAIMMYLAMTHPQHHLLGSSPIDIARSIEWLSWIGGGIHALPVAQQWRTERFTDDPAAYAGIRTKGMGNLINAFQLVEHKLSEATWAVAEHYSIVDPYLLVFFRWGNRLNVDMRKQFPNWTMHAQRMEDRDAVKTILKVEEISIWN